MLSGRENHVLHIQAGWEGCTCWYSERSGGVGRDGVGSTRQKRYCSFGMGDSLSRTVMATWPLGSELKAHVSTPTEG